MRKRLVLAIVAIATGATASMAQVPPAQQTAPQAMASKPLTVDATVGELLSNAAAKAVLARQGPSIDSSPQIDQARALSLRSLQVYMPTVLTDLKLGEIDAELARTPGAVSNANSPRAAPASLTDPWAAYMLPTHRLWEGKAPGQTGDRKQDIPTLTVVDNGNGTAFGSAVIVAPGGGYVGLASVYEGREVADWFAANGVTAFILSYRLTPFGYKYPAQLQDAKRAVRWVRAHAQEYGIDPNKIGMIGFSAGGHLTGMTSTLSDDGDPKSADPVERVSSKLDFAVLAYAPVDFGSGGSRGISGLLGDNPSPEALRAVSPVLNVTTKTPPTFIFQTTTDELVSSLNATAYYDALRKARVPAELHIFAEGRHGLGLGMTDTALSVWPSLLRTWLDRRGFLGSAAQPAQPVPPLRQPGETRPSSAN